MPEPQPGSHVPGNHVPEYKHERGEWGVLPEEPCRFCHKQGGVQFLNDDSPLGRSGEQLVRCLNCGKYYYAEGSKA